ncbi:CDP-diacylglycerol--glycerol-3-phosphate 3-phosphatidyltransferase [Ectothiorhodospiraceae bacterium BW-2]|nr:CDP-diacylglycerol--glycerol-3-phosphate 3-phosphatidyltransferase [Ectothiorhodospiraceae bacterium BW-2]
MTLPNLLTVARIVLIPFLVLGFYLPFEWSHLLATLLFILAAVTDWLDGYLARRMGLTSRFGAFLDPVADKLMVASVLVLVVDHNPTPYAGFWLALPATVIIGREIVVSALREWMSTIGASGSVAVSWLGKVKTTAQMVSLALLLYGQPLWGINLALWGLALLYLAALLTLWSMIDYLLAASRAIARQSEQQ